MNIRLMSNVPDNFILRQMKAVFQCYSQLHNAQIGRPDEVQAARNPILRWQA